MVCIYCEEETKKFTLDARVIPMSKLLEEITADENENDGSIPLQIKEKTFMHILDFCERSGYDQRKEIK